MLSLFNIWTVARFEAKTLSRSWFFRIFSGLSLIIMTLFTVFGLALANSPGVFWMLNASIPLANFKFLNILQAVIVIFLAADFLRRDRKLDSTEVIYTRSMSNADYVSGKTLGLLFVFIVLNLIFAVVAGFIHLFFSKVSFVFLPYIKFLLFFSLPTLVFMIGLTFFLMSVIRNQAVTFIILLAYSGVVLFYLAFRYHSNFDFLAFQVAAGDSDFIGMAMTLQTLLQRLSYLFFGISFIFFTIILLRRLVQSRPMHKISKVLAVLFLILALACIGYNYHMIQQGVKTRLDQIELNKKSAVQPVATITNMKLDIQHTNNMIIGTAKIVLTNQNNSPLEKYIFTLNPGLEIVKVSNLQQDLQFNREKQLLWITPANALANAAIDSLSIEYQGKIDENYMYPEVRESERARAFRVWLYHFQKKYAIIENNYVLLTPESNWYPVAGLSYGANYPEMPKKDFVNINLTVTTKPELVVISQGKSDRQEQAGKAVHTFTPEQPLSEISLVIGQYEKRSVMVDSTEYSLFTLKSHDSFLPHFKEIGDTLAALIREAKNNYENTLSLNYPFKRLNLVETPIQFTTYARPWTLTRESVLPELVLLPEKGVGCNSVEFEQMKKWAERRREFSGQVLTEQENQARMFMDFVKNNLTGASGNFFIRMNNWIPDGADFQLLPAFYYYKNHFSSTEWPIFNLAFESYFKNKIPEDRPGFMRSFTGLSDQEKCNIELDGKSIKTALSDTSLRALHIAMIQNKGNILFLNLQNQFGTDVFNNFIKDFLNENQFTNIPVDRFIQKIAEQFKIDFVPYFNNWFNDTLVAGYTISNIQGEQILVNERTRFQTRLIIENLEAVPGLVQLKFFQEGGGGRGFGFGPRGISTALETKIIRMNPLERKEIGVILDEAARRIEINTLISKNIPAIIDKRFSREPEVNKKAVPFEGERVLPPEGAAKEIEIIVDNEDPNFEIISEGKQGFLQRFFRNETDKSKKYGEVFYWRPPSQWKPTTDANFYGKFIHSAHVIKAGRGENKVAWKAEIPESGQYEVSYYPGHPGMMFFRGRGGPGGRGEGQRSSTTTLNFIVNHDDGEAKVPLEVNTSDAEWTYIGTYFFSKGEAKVLLTDQGNDRFVVADAVRWVKK